MKKQIGYPFISSPTFWKFAFTFGDGNICNAANRGKSTVYFCTHTY